MKAKERFVRRWKKEFGCKSESLCWCDTCVKLGFLYDDLVGQIAEDVMAYLKRDVDEAKVLRDTVGEENLPDFMKDRLSDKDWRGGEEVRQ